MEYEKQAWQKAHHSRLIALAAQGDESKTGATIRGRMRCTLAREGE